MVLLDTLPACDSITKNNTKRVENEKHYIDFRSILGSGCWF